MSQEENLAAVMYGVEDLRLEQRPIPLIKDHEVLLRMDSVGICGCDVHFLTDGRIGDFILTKPMITGHEGKNQDYVFNIYTYIGAGVVTEIGKSVKTLKVGDRVAIEPGVPCGTCHYCKSGSYNLCPEMVFSASPPYDGILTQYYAHSADFCFKLPDHVTMEEGALLEPLSVGVHACRRAGVGLATSVLILGAGPIGLVTLLTAKSMGAFNIAITDILPDRLEAAKSLGAHHTLLIDKDRSEKENIRLIHDMMGEMPNKTIDCTGTEETIRTAILATRAGGCVMLVGLSATEPKIPIIDGFIREVDIRGCFRYCNDYPAALALVSSGIIDVKKLITHHFDITETAEAFNTARYRLGGAMKVMIHCTPRNTNNPQKL